MPSHDARRYIAYYRVSTARQGRSGLGIEAQKQAVGVHLNGYECAYRPERPERGERNREPSGEQ